MKPKRLAKDILKAFALGLLLAAVCVGGLLCIMPGCAAVQTERGRLRTAADTYAAVTGSLADAWEAGKLNEEQKKAVVKWSGRAHTALKRWRRRLKAKGPADEPRQKFMRAVRILNDIWREVQSDGGAEK
jgi:hypothetical protein